MVSFLIQDGRYYKGLLIIYRGGMDGFSGGRVQEGAHQGAYIENFYISALVCTPPPQKKYIFRTLKSFPTPPVQKGPLERQF